MEFTDQHRQLDDTVTKFVRNEINPYVEEWERAEGFPAHELFKKLGDLGLLGLKYPEAYGGLGLDFSYSMVMDMVSRGKLAKSGVPMNEQAEAGLKAMSEQLKRRLDAESDVLYGTARLWDDGVIDPRDTRRVLAMCLAIAREADARQLRPNTFGVARM